MRRKENRKFLLLCLLMLLLCTSCASSSQNADGSPLEFFNRRILENPEWTLEAVTELGKYRAESICSGGEHLYALVLDDVEEVSHHTVSGPGHHVEVRIKQMTAFMDGKPREDVYLLRG